jgi:signal transduction histidine kinase
LRIDVDEIEIIAASVIFRTGQRELLVINLSEKEKQEPRNIVGKGTAPQAIDAGNLAARDFEFESSQRALRDQQPVESQRFELMGRLVGGVAHDFNNLLTGILLYCDLLTRGLDAQSPLRNYVQEIRKAGGHSSALIQQLLSATHTQGEDALPHSWSDVITGMQNFLTRMLGESIELVIEIDPGVALVSLSQTSMRQIALNLLLNARDAMPAGGRILVAVRNCADCVDTPAELLHGYVEFSVSDRGCGMDADTRDHLFDAFFTTKGPGHGFGLGLAKVQRIVTEAGGSLEVQSEPGQGTRVFVRLPQAFPEPLQKNQQPGPEIQKSETQLRA